MINQQEHKIPLVTLDLKLQCQHLCDYNNAYILIKGIITITGSGDNAAARKTDEMNK